MSHWDIPIRTSAPSLPYVRSKIAIIVSIINRFMTSMAYALRDLSDTWTCGDSENTHPKQIKEEPNQDPLDRIIADKKLNVIVVSLL
jgi:hypothetical protein